MKFQGSEMSPGLFQDVMGGYINPEDSPDYLFNLDDPSLNPMGSQFSIHVV